MPKKILRLIAALLILFSGHAFSQELVVNGSMEGEPGGDRAPPGWEKTNSTVDIHTIEKPSNGGAWTGTPVASPVSGGNFVGAILFAGASNNSESFAQDFKNLTIGRKYQLTYYFTAVDISEINYNYKIDFFSNVKLTGFDVDAGNSVNASTNGPWKWVKVTATLTATASTGKIDFGLRHPVGNSENNRTAGFDDVSLIPGAFGPGVGVGAPDHSGVRVVNDKQPSDGTASLELEAFVRDLTNQPAAGQEVAFSATASVGYISGAGNGAIGAAATCVTGATGLCSVKAFSTEGGQKSTDVSVAAGKLNANFSEAGRNYSVSPVKYEFNPAAPTATVSFSPPSGGLGDVQRTLTVTLVNPNKLAAITGVNFLLYYPDRGLLNANPPNDTTTCTGPNSGTWRPHDRSVGLSNGIIPAGGNCTLTIQVVPEFPDFYLKTDVTLAAGAITSTNAPKNAAAATGTLENLGKYVTLPLPPPTPVTCSTDGAIFDTGRTVGGAFKPRDSHDDHWMASYGTSDDPSSVTPWIPAHVVFGDGGINYGLSITHNLFYRYDFTLDSTVNLQTFKLNFYQLEADDRVRAIFVNGTRKFSSDRLGPTELTGDWQLGLNSIVILTDDADQWGTTTSTFHARGRVATSCNVPALNKAFTPPSFSSGGSTSLVFTVANGSAVDQTSGFTDTLPSGLQVAAGSVGGTCANATTAGVVSAPAGGKAVTVTGIAVSKGQTCTVTVPVTNSPGVTNPSCSANPVAFVNGPSNISGKTNVVSNIAEAGVCVTIPPPAAGRSGVRVVSDRQTADGIAVVRLEARLRDGADQPVSGEVITFGKTAGVKFGTGVVGEAGSCTTGPDGACSVDATSTFGGPKSTDVSLPGNVPLTGAFTADGNNYVAGPAKYSFVLKPPVITLSYTPDSVGFYGEFLSTLTITLTNPNAQAITGVELYNRSPDYLYHTIPKVVATTCGGTVEAGITEDLRLKDGTIPANGSCTITNRVSPTDLDIRKAYVNNLRLEEVRSANAPQPTVPATATLTVRPHDFLQPSPPSVSCSSGAAVFNSGYAGPGVVKNIGELDSQWMVGTGGENNAGPSSVAAWYPAYVVNPYEMHWQPSSSRAAWISYRPDRGFKQNHMYYRYTFDLASSVDAAAFRLQMHILADDDVSAIWVNGVDQKPQNIPKPNAYGVGAGVTTTVSTGWKVGRNELVIYAYDQNAMGGMMFEANNLACGVPGVTVSAVSTGGVGTFAYSGNNGFLKQSIITLVPGTAVAAPKQVFTAVAETRIEQAAPSGGYRLTGVACTGLGINGIATPTINADGSGSVLLNAAATTGTNVACTFTNTGAGGEVGRVITDDGRGAGVANDGLPNGGELGLAGVVVNLTDCAAGGVVHATAVTDGSGSYTLTPPASVIAGARVCVETPAVGGRQATGASVGGTKLPLGATTTVRGYDYTYERTAAGDRVAFPWHTDESALAPTFGAVPKSTLSNVGTKNGGPGSSVVYGHVFVAGTGETVSFSVPQSLSAPAIEGWTETVYADAGCTGELAGGATILYPPVVPVTVTAGQVVCVLMKEAVPAQAPLGSQNTATLEAAFTFSNAMPPLTASYVVQNLTRVGAGEMKLLQEVRNVTMGVDAFGVSNQARPGDMLEYRITYNNPTPRPVTELVLNATTPPHTRFVEASADTTPAALVTCKKTTPTAPETPVECGVVQAPDDKKGDIQWVFGGVLQAGETGSVLFRVKVD